MRFGTVKSMTTWDNGDALNVDVDVTFSVKRSVLYEFMDSLQPVVDGAKREPILAILDYSASLGEGLIVRCKDCRYGYRGGEYCERFGSYEREIEGEYAFSPAPVEPNGSCVWGERRGAEIAGDADA